MPDSSTDAAVEQPRKWYNAVRGNVLMMGLVSLFTDASSEMIYPLLPVFINGLVPLGWAALYVGLMEGIAESTASLLKIFSGRLSDALGKRKALVVGGYGISTVIRPLMGFALLGWHVIALRFLDRVGKGIRTSPRDALIGDSVDSRNRGLAFSFHRAMDHTGAVIGPVGGYVILLLLIGGTLLWQKGRQPTGEEMSALRTLFYIALVPGLFAMATLIFGVREIAPQKDKPTAQKSKATGRFEHWRQLPNRFYAFVGVVTLFALGNSSDLFILLYGQTTFGLGIGQVLGLWVLLHISKIVFSIPGGIISDRVGRRPVIIAGWIVYAAIYLGFALIAGGESPWLFWTLFVAYGFFYGMTEGVEKALVADFVRSEHYGTAYGVYHAAVGLAALPASLIFGVMWVWFESVQPGLGPKVAFSIGAALAGLAAVLLVLLVSTGRSAKSPAA